MIDSKRTAGIVPPWLEVTLPYVSLVAIVSYIHKNTICVPRDKIKAAKSNGISLIVLLVLVWVSASSQAQTVRYIHTDALGSPVSITNINGQVVERREYEPYGEQLLPSASDGPGYTGHVQDPVTGLMYMQQRYYDPDLGRFLSVDPVTAYESPIANFNRYVYARNNPYRFTDPDGRDSVGELIDSAANGCGAVSCAGWAATKALWTVFGAEGVSQVYDKGAGASTGDKVMAGVEVVTLGLGGKVGVGVRAIEGAAKWLSPVARAERLISRIATMGKEGSRGVREVTGTVKDARQMFDTLRAGNKVEEVRAGVFTADGANGGTVTFRAASNSGPPTVDVHGVVDGVRKVKFLEPKS